MQEDHGDMDENRNTENQDYDPEVDDGQQLEEDM